MLSKGLVSYIPWIIRSWCPNVRVPQRRTKYMTHLLSSNLRVLTCHAQCFGTFDPTAYQATDLSQKWRLWQFQVCTQWGFFAVSSPPLPSPCLLPYIYTPKNQTAPPPGVPSIVSKTQTVDYLSRICKYVRTTAGGSTCVKKIYPPDIGICCRPSLQANISPSHPCRMLHP